MCFHTHNLTKIDEKSLRPLIVPDKVQKSSISAFTLVELMVSTLMYKIKTFNSIFDNYFSLNLMKLNLEKSFDDEAV